MKAIVTMAPHSTFIDEVIEHPAVSGIRLNTVMPIKGTIEDVLKKLQSSVCKKELWIDLKCRQLRVTGYWVPPFTEIQVSHNIKVQTPATAYIGGTERVKILEVENNRLIIQDGLKRVVGPGESVNIIDPSLEIEGYFTETDLKYIETGKNIGLKKYMLSFVEKKEDIESFKKLFPEASVVAKIESEKGIDYVENIWDNESRLMAARGDLFVEVKMPHNIIEALETIIKKDKHAIVASRILDSLADSLEPSSADIGDLDNLFRMGYKNFMFGDEICLRRDSIISGLNLFYAMSQRYK